MSSSGGIGGGTPRGVPAPDAQPIAGAQAVTPGGVANVGAAQIGADGTVTVNGVALAIDTPEGAAALLGAVNGEELQQIKGMLRLKQVDSPEGPMLIPDDSFKKVDTAALRKSLGPLANEGGSDLDHELGTQVFEKNGVPNPYNSNTTPELYAKLGGTQGFKAASGALSSYLENPTQTNLQGFTGAFLKPTAGQPDGFGEYMKRCQAENPYGNIMEVLFLVFRQSIEQTNEDKKYFLTKLKMFNDMGEGLSNYLSDLVGVSRDLGAEAAGAKYPEMVLTASPVSIKKFDLTTTNAAGELKETSVESKRLDRAGLSDTIKEVESMQETVRNKRQMASTAFQNFDQKANQLYNLLSSVMKAMSEMRMGTVRNML